MTPESVMTLGRHAMEVTLMIAAPMLLVAWVETRIGTSVLS